jgi:uncharacterized protein with ATP-grasp and redox domains
MTSEPGSFARACIVERKPQIIRQVIENNDYPEEIVLGLEAFQDEIAHLPISPIHEAAPDIDIWNEVLSPYSGKTWLEVPWYFAEAYFYRKLLQITHYFQAGPWLGHDPFQKQKRSQIEADIQKLAPIWESLYDQEVENLFIGFLHSSLWGNRADLSNFTVREKSRIGQATHLERHLILIDDTDRVHRYLSSGVKRVDFVHDNAGRELLFDLALADFLLQKGWARQVHLHLKNQPFFVSDAMPDDVQLTMQFLSASPSPRMQELNARLVEELANGRLSTHADPFWTSCLMFRDMPEHLKEQIGLADLVLIKGDVNYRRLLSDAHWPFTTRMEYVCGYFPAPFVAMRTLKGEILVGLQPGQAEALTIQDPTWLINGKRGLIQFVQKPI